MTAPWDGYPPDRDVPGYHWLQPEPGNPWSAPRPCEWTPRNGGYPGGWEFIGQSQLSKPETLAKHGWLYVAPVESAPFRWVRSDAA